VLLVSDGMHTVALSSPVEISGNTLTNMEGLSILDIDRFEGLGWSVDSTEEALEVKEGPVSQGVRLHVMGHPAVGAFTDLSHDLAVDRVLDGLGNSENCSYNN